MRLCSKIINFLLLHPEINFIWSIIHYVFWFLFFISEAGCPIIGINNILVFLFPWQKFNTVLLLKFQLFKMIHFHTFISITANLRLCDAQNLSIRSMKNVIILKHLRLVPAIFYQIFIFSPIDSPSETMKSVFYFI